MRVVAIEGKTHVVFETTGDVDYRDFFSGDTDRLTVDLVNARLATPAAAVLVDRGGVREIELSQTGNDVVRLVIHFDEVDDYSIFEEGNDLHVAIDADAGEFAEYDMAAATGGGAPGAAVAAAAPADALGSPPGAERVTSPGARRNMREIPREAAPPAVGARQDGPVDDGLPEIDGAPISVDFQQADIQTVIRSFAEFGGVSIVAGSQVTGTITATIRDMPWDQALVSIMRANGYEVAYENGIVRIDSIANLRAVEQLEDLETRVLHLSFVSARDVVTTLDKFRSQRGAITADAKTNTVIITDVPGRVAQIVSVIDQLDVQTRQVTIKAKIVFVNKTDLEQFGITWRAENLRNPLVDTKILANSDGADFADPFLTLSIATVASGLTVGGLLQALEQQQIADVQAEPQTTVLNNLPAEIFVGERTPIRVLDIGADEGQAQATVELIETGIILDVTPHITPTGKVLMELHAERSGVAVNDPAVGVTFNTQRARTQILVDDGETAVIGGLTVQDISRTRSGIPLLMDIPVIGSLFSRREERREKRDLLIFVTPFVVPLDPEEVAEVRMEACLEDQDWYRSDEAVLHNGVRWVKFGSPRTVEFHDLYVVGNYRGLTVYADPDTVRDEVYLPVCGEDRYQVYRREAEVRGTTG
ncbi:MAG: AMIN domain-containing protein [Gemmatimonadetes bacterium]|nr:AMIN domain-containing protein [Gemmatimonadota bacterium]